MEIVVTIPPDGSATVETISILEDLWHDYQFFKHHANTLGCADSQSGNDRLLAKRFRRAALLMLYCYLEGVVNRWLKDRLPLAKWNAIDKEQWSLGRKVNELEATISATPSKRPRLDKVREIRNALVHLKPGNDLKLYNEITDELLGDTEESITTWLAEVESLIGVTRHPNTREESKALRQALGKEIPGSEGYSGPTD